MFDICELLIDSLKFFLQKFVMSHVEVILFEPSAFIFFSLSILPFWVLHTSASIHEDPDESENEWSLADGVGDGLHQIPAQPVHMVDSVVSHEKLSCEKACCRATPHNMPFLLFFLDFLSVMYHLIELSLGDHFQGVELEDTLAYNSVFKEIRLWDKSVAKLVHWNCWTSCCTFLWSCLLFTFFTFSLCLFFFNFFSYRFLYCSRRAGCVKWQIGFNLFQNSWYSRWLNIAKICILALLEPFRFFLQINRLSGRCFVRVKSVHHVSVDLEEDRSSSIFEFIIKNTRVS